MCAQEHLEEVLSCQTCSYKGSSCPKTGPGRPRLSHGCPRHCSYGAVADAQNARNSCFPEAIASPVVGLLLMAVTAALDHWTLSGDNPIRALSLTLVQMLAVIGPLAAESTAAMAEGDFSWTEGSDQPSMQEIAQSMTELRTELELATDSMVRWRLEKDRVRHSCRSQDVLGHIGHRRNEIL